MLADYDARGMGVYLLAQGEDVESWVMVADESIVGDVSLQHERRDCMNVWLSYQVAAAAQHRGYGTEAAAAVVAYARLRPDISTVYAEILDGRPWSEKVAAAAGLRRTDRKDMGWVWMTKVDEAIWRARDE